MTVSPLLTVIVDGLNDHFFALTSNSLTAACAATGWIGAVVVAWLPLGVFVAEDVGVVVVVGSGAGGEVGF